MARNFLMLQLSHINRSSAFNEIVGLNFLTSQRSFRTKNTSTAQSDDSANIVGRTSVSAPKTLSLIDKGTACDVARMVHNTLSDAVPIIEMHPGQGYLTENLLKSGVRNLFVFEPRSRFQPHIQSLFQHYKMEENCFLKNLYSSFFIEGKFIFASYKSVGNIFPFIHKKDWECSPSFNIVGAHTSLKFWLWILLNLSLVTKYHGFGRPQLVMAFPKREWDNMFLLSSQTRGRHPAGTLFPDLFEWEVLGNVPRAGYVPVRWKSKSKGVPSKNTDEVEEMVVVCITPFKRLFHIFDCSSLKEILYFVDQHLNALAKKQYVIQSLEKWIPGCGPNFILKGFNVTQKFEDLSSQQIIALFLTFKSLPEYSSSAFIVGMKDPDLQYLDKKSRKQVVPSSS